jgi:HK97 family phage prohead protease
MEMAALHDNNPVPSISLLPAGVDGEGVEATGWLCRFNELDSENEQFSIIGFKSALEGFMRNPVVLFNHARSQVPIGRVTKADLRPEGLWGSVVIPKSERGTKGREVYEAVKNGLLKSFSISGMFEHIGNTILVKRLIEVSIATQGVHDQALIHGPASVVQVKALGDSWVAADEWDARQFEAETWLRRERARKMADRLQLRREVNKMQLAALRNTVASL